LLASFAVQKKGIILYGYKHKIALHQYSCFKTQNYIFSFQNLSLGFILKIFLKFRKYQPRYSYKIYSYKEKRVYY